MKEQLAASLEELHGDAFGWALHCCNGSRTRAEDVLQNAYLKVMQGAVPSSDGPLKTWWFGVIRFTAQEEWRRQARRDSWPGRLLNLLFQSPQEEADPRPCPARQAELSERAMHLRSLLAQLPNRQAAVLHLVFYQDLTLAEAASVLGLNIGSVRQHYDRGKARLRALLQNSAHLLLHE